MDSKDDALEELNELEHADIQLLSCCSEDSLTTVTDLSMDVASEEEGCKIPIYTSVKTGGRRMGFRTKEVLNYMSDLEDFDISSLYSSSKGSTRTMLDTRVEADSDTERHATIGSAIGDLQSHEGDHEQELPPHQEADTPIGLREGSLQTKQTEATKPETTSLRDWGGIASQAEIRKKAVYISETVSPKSLPTLHRAVWKGKLNKVFKYLNRANNQRKVNKLDRFGRTALMIAAVFDRSEIVRILLMFGADPALKDRDNEEAMSYAPKPSKSAEVFEQFMEESGSMTAETTVKDHHKQVERVVSEKSAKQIISGSKKHGEQSGLSLSSVIEAQGPVKEDDRQCPEIRNSTPNRSSERPSLLKRVRNMFKTNQKTNKSERDLTAEEWAIEYKLLAMKYGALAKELQASKREKLALTKLIEELNLSREELQRQCDQRIIERAHIRLKCDLLQDNLLASRGQSSDLNLRFSQQKTWFSESLDFVCGLHEEKEQLLVKKESHMKLINQLIYENNRAAEEIVRLRKAASFHPNF